MPLAEKETKEYFIFFNHCISAVQCGQPFDEGEFNRIHSRLLKLKRITPTDPEVWDKLGMAACVLGNKSKIIDYHKAAIRLNPAHFMYYHNFATSLYVLNDLKEALFYTNKAIEMKPNYIPSRIRYIECLELMGKVEEAKKYLGELLKDKFADNEDLIEKYEDLLDHEIMPELVKRANDPPENFIPIEQAISELRS